MPGRFSILVSICCALAGAACAPQDNAAGWATLDGGPPLVIAHRGASGYLPEHTLEAYALAVEQGADMIEPDLVVTKDGVLVARHDRFLSTTTNVADRPEFADRRRVDPDPDGNGRTDWWIEDFTLPEIKSLRARQPYEGRSTEFDGRYDIPTFEDVLTLAADKAAQTGRPVGVYPETKHPGYFQSVGLDFEAPLLSALQGFDAGPVFIQSFEPGILKRLKGKTGAALVQLVYETEPGAGSNIPLEDIAAYADGVGPSKFIIASDSGSTDFIGNAHDLGLFVHSWTFRDDAPRPGMRENHAGLDDAADSAFELSVYYLMGVDGVFADFPDTAVQTRDAVSAANR